jgi:carbon storage regulator
MLILSRKVNEKIMIGNDITISVIEIRGDQVKLGIQAPPAIKIYRQEVFDAILLENKAAAQSTPNLPEVDLGKLGNL